MVLMELPRFLDVTQDDVILEFNKHQKKIPFRSNGVLTLGVEVELQLIEPSTFDLASRAGEILKASKHIKKIKPEFYLSTIELNTEKCSTVHEIREDLEETTAALSQITEKLGIQFSSTGTHPFAKYSDCIISHTDRYQKLIDRNQWITRRMTVLGLLVHLGMASGDDCIRFNNFFVYFLPHLLAISSSSPYWQGLDTGLASCRPTTYESLPTAGQPYFVKKWSDFELLHATLKKCGSIKSAKDLWWDLRPSPNFGTLEIRICDSPATLYEILAVTAFIHTLAHWFFNQERQGNELEDPSSHWLARENKWRAIRYGVNAELIIDINGQTKLLWEDIKDWIVKLEPYAEKLGYQSYMANILTILERGTSSERQRQIFCQTNSLKDVVKHNINEFLEQQPLW